MDSFFNIIRLNIVCWLLIPLSVHGYAISLRIGTIEFPCSLKNIPEYKIFYEGQKIPTEIDGHKLLFTIPLNRTQQRFFIIFTEKPSFLVKESIDDNIPQNTIDHLIVDEGTEYRLFELRPYGNAWRCEEYVLPDNLIIPDNTICVCMPPSYIDSLVDGNRFELPRILIKQNIVELLGPTQELHNKVIMETINFNALNVPIKNTVRIATGNKRIVVPTV